MKNILLYNSLTNQMEELKPIKAGEVQMYFCGPTVYNDPHIGNLRPPVFFDFFRRFLQFLGYKTTIAHNITDVDDKIIDAAQKRGISENQLSEEIIKRYFLLLSDLNIAPFDFTPKVTETIPEIIALISTLLQNGYAYQVNGNVYFRVNMIEDYGAIANINREELEIGARIEENSEKESPLDFALWKKTEVGLRWPSPFSTGRPGWHSECVAMIEKIFHSPIDIHGGGFDLKFPHHTNEIAQAQGAFNHHIASIWCHLGFLNLNNNKMSKSLGNILSGIEALKKYGANALRLQLLSTYYRAPINFSDETIAGAISESEKILSTLRSAQLYILKNHHPLLHNKEIKDEMELFIDYLAKDLNISNALSVVHEVLKKINVAIKKEELKEVERLENILYNFVNIIGFSYKDVILSKDDLDLLTAYEKARTEKDFIKSDVLRKELIEKKLI